MGNADLFQHELDCAQAPRNVARAIERAYEAALRDVRARSAKARAVIDDMGAFAMRCAAQRRRRAFERFIDGKGKA